MTEENVGVKMEDQASFLDLYSLYDRAAICPLWVYIDATVNDNLTSLIRSGERPPDEVLRYVKTGLSIELAELSGNPHAQAIKSSLRKIYQYKATIQGAGVAIELLMSGDFDEAIAWFKKRGIQANDVYTLTKKAVAFVKSTDTKMKIEVRRYEKLIASDTGESITEMYYTEMLISLSKHAGFRLDKNIMLAEYAAYIKDLKVTIERSKQYGRK